MTDLLGPGAHSLVQRISDEHVQQTRRWPTRRYRHHVGTIRGCAWCVDDEREALIESLIRHLNPDEWWSMNSHTARFLIAALDLADDDDPPAFTLAGPSVSTLAGLISHVWDLMEER